MSQYTGGTSKCRIKFIMLRGVYELEITGEWRMGVHRALLTVCEEGMGVV